MLKDAMEQARQGRKVYVVAADHAEKQRLEDLLGEDSGISVGALSSLGNFDWPSMSLIGAHSNCFVLADHFAIGKHFRRALEMLHKYGVE